MSKLEKLEEGDSGQVVLVDTRAFNRLIDKMNAMIDMDISPQGVGKYLVSDKNAVLDLTPLEQKVFQWVQAAVNGGAGGGAGGGGGSGGGTGGNPPGGGGSGGGGGGNPEFEYWRNNMQWTATCNGDGTITIKPA
jgi:hypothetical protein